MATNPSPDTSPTSRARPELPLVAAIADALGAEVRVVAKRETAKGSPRPARLASARALLRSAGWAAYCDDPHDAYVALGACGLLPARGARG